MILDMANKPTEFYFSSLVSAIQQVHKHLAAQAGRAVNISLTLRNWLIGAYIAEYELSGADKATYGDNLLLELAKRLTGLKVSNCNRRQLYRHLRFYRLYPEIMGTLSPQLKIDHEKLIQRLSYSHLEMIVELDDALKRTFYEIECMRGNWSVRELKRQISSPYYEAQANLTAFGFVG
jgi:hypothetical protein